MLRTSPTLYMMFSNILATNPCGYLGPVMTSMLIPVPPSEAYTFQPYANSAVATRMGPPKLFDPNDLEGCPDPSFFTMPQSQATGSLAAPYSSYWAAMNLADYNKPLPGEWIRCNPHFVMPSQVRELAE